MHNEVYFYLLVAAIHTRSSGKSPQCVQPFMAQMDGCGKSCSVPREPLITDREPGKIKHRDDAVMQKPGAYFLDLF